MAVERYNPEIQPLINIIDKENGKGYVKNLKTTGCILKLPVGDTQMLYEIKHINNICVVFIKYIHYDSVKELYNLLAFASKWWVKLNPHMIYYREKDRNKRVGNFLKTKLGFNQYNVANDLQEFECLNDSGHPCKCKIYECVAYKPR